MNWDMRYYWSYPEGRKRRKVDDLRHICLECISENLERFNTAYNTSEDPHVQRNLKFLQKFYSAHLLQKLCAPLLCQMYSVDEKYLKFLVNEYLKDLEVGVLLPGCALDSIVNRMAEVGHSFLKVLFENISSKTTDKQIAKLQQSMIAHLPNVEVLRPLRHCNDKTLKLISATCVNLKELYLDGSSVTDKGLKLLCRCTSLNVISLNYMGNIKKGIAYLLKNMPSLQVIDYADLAKIIRSLHKKDIKKNRLDSVQGYNLTTLILDKDSDELAVFTKLCPGLKTLDTVVRKEDDIKLISSFSKLENLSVSTHHLQCIAVDYNIDDFLISSGGGMRKLDLLRLTLTTGLLIETCPKLEVLTLGSIHFLVTEKEEDVRKLNSLRKLYFKYMELTDSATQQSIAMLLSSAPRLERLAFIKVDFAASDGIGEILAKFCEKSGFEQMTFMSCDFDEDLLTSIVLSNACLKSLMITYCRGIGSREIQNIINIVESAKKQVEIFWQGRVNF